MVNTSVIKNSSIKTVRKTAVKTDKGHKALAIDGSMILITAMFVIGTVVALFAKVPVKTVMKSYSYDVLVILIVMELFTNLIAETGIMQFLAIKIAELSKGKKRLCLMMFGGMMFIISSCLNNITAVMMILPIVFVLLKTIEVDRKYVAVFFASILAISNTGGAASPVGDFPAITILTSGITDFLSYLTHAFPLFAVTTLILIAVWGLSVKREKDDGTVRTLAIGILKSQYKNCKVRKDVMAWLGVVFAGMFIAWSVVPQSVIPPEMIAVIGYTLAIAICAVKKVSIRQSMDLKSVLTIASFLFFAQVVSQTGILNLVAGYLQSSIADPKLLVITIMLITSLISGACSAGPAAAAMMPVIIELCRGPLAAQSDWVAVAYAAAICAGSSLFMWSATAGFILSGKVNAAQIEENGKAVSWGVGEYFKYGLINYVIQLSIAVAVIWVVL